MGRIYTFGEVRELLGLSRPQTVGDLVEVIGLQVKPVPHNGNGRGLDQGDVEVMRDRLRKHRPDSPSLR